MYLRLTFVLAASAALSLHAHPQSFLQAETSARYQGTSGTPGLDVVNFPVSSLPAVAEARSHVPVGGATSMGRADRVTAYDEVDAWAKITHPGVEQTYARAGGLTPLGGNPNSVIATSRAISWTQWKAVGPEGQSVPVDLFYFLDGWLFAGRSGDWTSSLTAQVHVKLMIDKGNGFEQILFARGALWHSTGLNAFFEAANGWSDSDWVSSWTDTSGTLTSLVGNDRMVDLEYDEAIPHIFEVEANRTFTLSYEVNVSAVNNIGPSGAFATADFSNTAGLDLSTSLPGYTMEETGLVPEPGSVFALGAVVLVWRRRRRSKVKA